jgi:hypothetical protein
MPPEMMSHMGTATGQRPPAPGPGAAERRPVPQDPPAEMPGDGRPTARASNAQNDRYRLITHVRRCRAFARRATATEWFSTRRGIGTRGRATEYLCVAVVKTSTSAAPADLPAARQPRIMELANASDEMLHAAQQRALSALSMLLARSKHLPGALDPQDVPTATCPPEGPRSLGPRHRAVPRLLRPLGVGQAPLDDQDGTSGVTGDCHAPFHGSPGVRFPRATRPWVRVRWAAATLWMSWSSGPSSNSIDSPSILERLSSAASRGAHRGGTR